MSDEEMISQPSAKLFSLTIMLFEHEKRKNSDARDPRKNALLVMFEYLKMFILLNFDMELKR